MQGITGLLVLVLSFGMIAVAVQGAIRGWLPNGPNGLRRGRGVSRRDDPIAFWFFFCLYVVVGGYGTLHALQLLSGHAAS